MNRLIAVPPSAPPPSAPPSSAPPPSAPPPTQPTPPVPLVELLDRYLPAAAAEVRTLPDRDTALRTLRSGLAEVASRRSVRRESARRRALATEQLLSRRRDGLVADRREAGVGWPRRARAELAQVRVTASGELAAAVRQLRDDAREQLESADGAARTAFPAALAGAVAELSEQVCERLDELVTAAARSAFAGPVELGRTRRPTPRIPAPPRGRPAVQDRLMLLAGASGGLGLARLAWAGGGPVPNIIAVPVAVGLGVGAVWWLAGARRGAVERACLARWVTEVLSDARAGLEAVLSERLLDVDRQLGAVVDEAASAQVAVLDAELAEHERCARRVAVRRAEVKQADAVALAQLRAAISRVDTLLAGPTQAADPAQAAATAAARTEQQAGR